MEDHSLLDEVTLVEQAKTDEVAFTKLYEHYFPKIFAFVTRRISNRSEAEDIVSQIFLRVVEHLRTYNPRKSSFKTWLYAIATNSMIDHYRRHSKRSFDELEKAEILSDPRGTPQESAHREQERVLVHRVINELPERHQKVISLKYFSDFSVQEIAETLGVSENNASVMVHRALKAFHLTYERYV